MEVVGRRDGKKDGDMCGNSCSVGPAFVIYQPVLVLFHISPLSPAGSFSSPSASRGFFQSSYLLVLFLFSPSHPNISSPNVSALRWAMTSQPVCSAVTWDYMSHRIMRLK